MTRLAGIIATVGGAGYFPIAPGTIGSAVGVGVYLATRGWTAGAKVLLVVLIAVVGTWAAGVTARALDREDPGPVVIDEVAGQLVTLLFTAVSLSGAILGFFVFRLFDIIKPFPARRLEDLPGGWGIMADDLMAGAYAWLVVVLVTRWWPAAW